MHVRTLTWRATIGAGLLWGAACLVLARAGWYWLSALLTMGLLWWSARQVVDLVPSLRRPRVEPRAWSPYDRRRSGRKPRGLRSLGRWARMRVRRPRQLYSDVAGRYGPGEGRGVSAPPRSARDPRSERFREPDVR